MHIVCPRCLDINRISHSQLSQRPKCSACHQAMFTGHPFKLSSRNFDLILAHTDIPIAVMFWKIDCPTCKTMETAYQQAASHLEPWVRVTRVNMNQERAIPGLYKVDDAPTLLVFKNEQEVGRVSGLLTTNEIMRWVSQYV
ncbi:hypothetical protein VZ94_10015 [Methylocucumis oryzae]|uniref:Uncharacterized protein n=2 Tax=Methylocucumis oryzae TaxID=1632867 RepID=A0A0F3IM45_9GAMM|nr:hypothetical protein VZ94_10015 [Methylocucumis oryzae]